MITVTVRFVCQTQEDVEFLLKQLGEAQNNFPESPMIDHALHETTPEEKNKCWIELNKP